MGNNPLDYDYIHNQKTGEKVQIEMNEDIKADKIEPQTISNELPFNSSGGKSETKRHLFNLLKINDNGKKVKNINTNEIVTVNKNTIEKSLSNVGVNESGYKDFVSMLVNIEDLFKTSQKILSHNDVKNVSDTKISRYANIAKVGDNGYLLEFVAKDNGEVSLYSVDMLNKEAVPANVSVNKTSTPGTADISIADIQKIFKSKLIKKYNNDYKNGIDTDFNPQIRFQKDDDAIGLSSFRKNGQAAGKSEDSPFDANTKDTRYTKEEQRTEKREQRKEKSDEDFDVDDIYDVNDIAEKVKKPNDGFIKYVEKNLTPVTTRLDEISPVLKFHFALSSKILLSQV